MTKKVFLPEIPAGEGHFAFQNAQPYAEQKFLWIRWPLDTQ
jgi:hypothetical protein